MKVRELRHLGHKVVDVFPFFNEFELLELRLTILSPYVDLFVLVECAQTFSGNAKPLFFTENRDKFEKWKDKLVAFVVEDPLANKRDLKSRLLSEKTSDLDKWILELVSKSSLTKGAFHWKQEFYQKESARKALDQLNDSDLVFYGDLDEIWNPEMVFEWNENSVYKLEQTVFQYWMNNRSSENWDSAFFTAAKNIRKHSLNILRSTRSGEHTVKVAIGGWHFTYQGGEDQIRYKIESYGHQEFNKKRFKSHIGNQMLLNQDLFKRNIKFTEDDSILPLEVLEMKDRLPSWFL
jgi:beta-1,4-mannosyl-glycoprotein beta-1,4-N-acetylglucosaminyltransferase